MNPNLEQRQSYKIAKMLTATDLTQVAAIIEQAIAENTNAAYRKDLAYFLDLGVSRP